MINKETANALGLTIPASLLFRVDVVFAVNANAQFDALRALNAAASDHVGTG